jgi:hypothetical protein
MLPHLVMAVFVGVVDGKEMVDEAVLDVALVAAGKRAPLRGARPVCRLCKKAGHTILRCW